MIRDSWIDDVARAWTGGPEGRCQANHGEHATIRVDSWHLGTHVSELTVFDAAKYQNTAGYCSGDDDVSKSVAMTGDYERPQSAMVREILNGRGRTANIAIDLGCHVGWYTLILAAAGCEVVAVDADEERLRVLGMNVAAEGFEDRVTPVRGWIGVDTPEIPMDSARHVVFAKADLESLESEAVRVLAPLLKRGMVDYFLMEVSPVFADHYPDTVMEVIDCGYAAYVVPGVANEDLWGVRLDLMEDARGTVASWHQRDVLFARKALTA